MSLFSSLVKTSKTPTYQGVTPYNDLRDAAGGEQYYQTLLDRLAGRNVGFGDSYASKYANPIINQSRSNFESYQLPELTSELSVTGRRSGSGGNDAVRRAYQEQGNNENAIFSQLQQRNEDQSRGEINDALTGLGTFNMNEAGVKQNAANFDKGVYDSNTRANQYDQEANKSLAANWLNYGQDTAAQLLSAANGGSAKGAFSRQPAGASYGIPNYATSTPLTSSANPYGYASTIARMNARNGQYGGSR